MMRLLKAHYFLSGLLATTSLFLSCSSSPKFPKLSIDPLGRKDSIALVLMQGDSLSRMDTILLESGTTKIAPDTTLYNKVYVLYPLSDNVLAYELKSDEWSPFSAQELPKSPLKAFPAFSVLDVSHKDFSTSMLTRRKKGCYIFADLDGKVLSFNDRRKLSQLYPKDSMEFVFLYMTPRDSVARSFAKRDSLKGVIVSDSLGDVSRLRKELGIDRSPKIYTFVVDSTRKILKQQ